MTEISLIVTLNNQFKLKLKAIVVPNMQAYNHIIVIHKISMSQRYVSIVKNKYIPKFSFLH